MVKYIIYFVIFIILTLTATYYCTLVDPVGSQEFVDRQKNGFKSYFQDENVTHQEQHHIYKSLGF